MFRHADGTRHPVARARRLGLLVAGLALVGTGACSDGGGNGGGGGGGGNTTSFLGIMATDDGQKSGEVSITIQSGSLLIEAPTAASLSAFTATGSHKLEGPAVALSGTYDDQTKDLTLTGGGYTLAGTFDGVDRLEGAFSGPGASGTFVTAKRQSGTAAYCGTFTGDDDGTFSFTVSGGKVLGTAVPISGGAAIPLDGVKSGSAITIYVPGTTLVLAAGTISGSNVSGTWDDHQGSTGTWSGSVCP